MWELIAIVVRSSASALRLRRDLALENLALRHQLGVLKRQMKKPRFEDRDRLLWIALTRIWPGWAQALDLLRPATIVNGHRAGFRAYWRRKSRRRPGRPKIDLEVHKLIRDMWNSNPTWGKPRIQAELAKLGINISDSTVAKYRPKRRKPPSLTWPAFLDNHVKDIVALDFFTVPTATFRVLYVLGLMTHERRRILHFNVTDTPSPGWAARQLLEAFPYDTAPRFLLRDNDANFAADFRRCAESLGIEEIKTAPQSPWQNAFCERLIGSIRRECLDHLVVLNEQHLRRALKSYATYYHTSRTHQSLQNDCPDPRAVQPAEMGDVIKIAHVGALHHRYTRRVAA